MTDADQQIPIRRIYSQVETAFPPPDGFDLGAPLRKVAVVAVIDNPFAGQGFVADLSALVNASHYVGSLIGGEAATLLGEPVQSYGKAAVAGLRGEQEHANATITATFGASFRAAIGGGAAWITSVTKVAGPAVVVDVPLAFKDEIWVRSHYDSIQVTVPGGPLPDEILVIAAVANRGRIDARVGGLSHEEATARLAPAGSA
jgi:hypothetical protein